MTTSRPDGSEASGTRCCLTVDFDAASLWLTNFRAKSPSLISRGEYAVAAGLPRLLDLLADADIIATFFVPLLTLRMYPTAVAEIVSAGHEIGSHGDLHERQLGMSHNEELEFLRRCRDELEQHIGLEVIGFRSPGWELTPSSIDCMEQVGFRYDSSMMGDDFRPYLARSGDAIEAGVLQPGSPSGVVEFPISWELDDFPYFVFLPHPYPFYSGTTAPSHVFEIWKGELEYMCSNVENGLLTLVVHPEIVGRGPRIEMLREWIELAKELTSCGFGTMRDAHADFSQRLGMSSTTGCGSSRRRHIADA